MNIIIIRVPDTQKFEKLGYRVFRIDRQTPVGNPYYMHTEAERDKVCDEYQTYFNNKINTKKDTAFLEYIRSIYNTALHYPTALACWCAPKRCHGETIKEYIETLLKEVNKQ